MAPQGEDPKVTALRDTNTLNPHPDKVVDERFSSSDFFDPRDAVQVKYEMVRAVEQDGMPIARAAAAFGYSRPAYYAAAQALTAGGLAALVPAKPGPKGGHKLTEQVCAFAQARLATDSSLRAGDLVEVIEEHFGVRVHPRSIERALARYREHSKSR